MTKPNQNLENDNSLYAWANGICASVAIGLAVGTFIYKSGIITKFTDKFFKRGFDTKTTQQKENQY